MLVGRWLDKGGIWGYVEGLYSGVGVFVYCENGTPGAALGVFVVKRGVVD